MNNVDRKGSVYVVLLIIVVVALAIYIINDKTNFLANAFTPSQTNVVNQPVPMGNPPQPTTPAATQPSKPATPPGTFEISQQSMGSSFVVNGLQFTVLSAKNLGSSLSALGSPTQTTQGHYVETKISAKNVGTNNATLDNVLFAYQDSSNREFTTSFDSMMFVNVPGYQVVASTNNSFGMSVIKPGFTENYVFITDVAKDSTGIKIIIANQSTQNYFVQLGF